MNYKKWFENNTKDLTGKVVAITGSTGGLGEQVCFHLASLGANFIFLNRNLDKSKSLEEKIREKFSSCQIEHIQVDMEDRNSVKDCSFALADRNVDVLILNAGTYKIPRKRVGEFDNIFQINFLSPYTLAKKCLETNNEVKIVAVGSIAHKGVRLNEKDIALLNCKKDVKLYGNAKRFLMFSLHELMKGESVAIAHPGITFTNITSHYPKFLVPIIKFFMKIIFSSTKKASLSIVKGVFDDCEYGSWIGPRVFDIWGKPKHKKLKTFCKEEAEKMFKIANEKADI